MTDFMTGLAISAALSTTPIMPARPVVVNEPMKAGDADHH